jgi:CheY-like chemotaxis protein
MRTEPAVVFYVDDNPKSRRLLASILRERGFEVITACDAIEALGVCKGISFDLALLDYRVPRMTGSQLAQEIKLFAPHVPVVLISGEKALPPAELAFVDAHFGSGSLLEELLEMLSMLVEPKPHTVAMSRWVVPWADST